MFEQKFKLKSRPFTSTPYAPNYFAAESIQNALAQSRQCIERASGPVIVTGPPGTGKSLVLVMLAEQFNSEYNVIALTCTRMVQRTDLLQNILFELQLPYRNLSEGELRLSLIDYLKTKNASRSGMLLLVDEAHGLSPDLLDELRLITNFVRNGRPQVSLVMAGTSALEDHLIETKSESFNQRIAARCYLSHLRQTETFEYILTHIDRAGGNGDELFTGEALKLIHQASQGCPRVINQICDCSLVLAANAQSARITAEIVKQAWNDVQSIPGSLTNETSSNGEAYSNANWTNNRDQSAEDKLLTVEFGQLDDDVSQTGGFQQGELQHSSLQSGRQIQTDHSPVGSNHDFGPAVELLDGHESSETMNPYDESNHPNTVGNKDSGGVHGNADLPNFENPFDEQFDHEEKLNLTYFPIVSEQNISSLMLTREQLSILDRVEARSAPILTDDVHDQLSMFTAGGVHSPSPQPLDDQEHLDDSDNGDDLDLELKLSPEEMASLEQIEEDVRRLQHEYRTSRTANPAAKIPSPYVARSDNQPLEEFMQTWADSHLESKTGTAISVTRETGNGKPQLPEKSGIVKECTDDRDILIVNRPEHLRNPDSLDRIDADAPSHFFNTGNATRMDYHKLFQQLRQNQ